MVIGLIFVRLVLIFCLFFIVFIMFLFVRFMGSSWLRVFVIFLVFFFWKCFLLLLELEVEEEVLELLWKVFFFFLKIINKL